MGGECPHAMKSHPQHHLFNIAHLPKLVRGGFPAARCAEMFLVQRKNKTPQWLFGRKHNDATAPISSEGLGHRSRNVVWRTDQSRFPELN